ncbi:sulfotransferase domain-containing protein [Polymorphum gilvum]|uniref:Sulfotransferase, putative n=1 Tax=Polymorphum gilvum (strain LMG 25793 / CGMCC 1.9160 / SL003B-26A1) TaxID=991905 RepID=F2IW76_POLGS|nr:sulfotransferase domain-containing protein [Polymorphum gilvum]ADZ71461.1 Sulfotransferase, putative [Polymorphum gilvum SL003B-26A1]
MAAPRPNTFLIGGPKCGTTSLAHYLSEHPDVFLGYPKEPSYWSSDLAQSGTVALVRSLNDYLNIYSSAEGKKVVLDASTRYLFSKVAVRRIVEFNPKAKFIVILRNPIEAAYAYHMEKVFNHFEDEEDFEIAWKLQSRRLQGHSIPSGCDEPKELQYQQVASFGSQLASVLEHVKRDDLLVLFTEDMASDARGTYLKVLDFLDLEDDGRTDFKIKGGAHFNRFQALSRLYQNPPKVIRPVIRSLKQLIRRNFPLSWEYMIKKVLVTRKARKPLSEEMRRDLASGFCEDVKLLEKVTGKDLRHWLDAS